MAVDNRIGCAVHGTVAVAPDRRGITLQTMLPTVLPTVLPTAFRARTAVH